MRPTRILDITIFALVAVAVLIPRPDVTVKPALRIDAEGRTRVAELQALLVKQPGDIDASMQLADLFIDGRRADWALAALAPAIAEHPADHRLHLRRSLALAEFFEARAAFDSADRAFTLCEHGSSVPCGEADHARLSLLRSSLDRVKDLDMRGEPNAVKERLIKGLRPGYLPRRR